MYKGVGLFSTKRPAYSFAIQGFGLYRESLGADEGKKGSVNSKSERRNTAAAGEEVWKNWFSEVFWKPSARHFVSGLGVLALGKVRFCPLLST